MCDGNKSAIVKPAIESADGVPIESGDRVAIESGDRVVIENGSTFSLDEQ